MCDFVIETEHDEGVKASYSGVEQFVARYHEHGFTTRRPGSGRPTKVTHTIKCIVDRQMEADDKTTVVQLQSLLAQKASP